MAKVGRPSPRVGVNPDSGYEVTLQPEVALMVTEGYTEVR